MADTQGFPDFVEAHLNYSVDSGVMPVTETRDVSQFETVTERINHSYVPQRMRINNGRLRFDDFDLDRNGFVFAKHETQMKDFYDEQELRDVYHPEMVELIKAKSGASRVYVFDHTVRSYEKDKKMRLRTPVHSVHNDYTEWSARKRVADFMGEEAGALLAKRFAVIQTWRPINKAIEEDPLAISDGATLDEDKDLLLAERRYPDRVGQTYRVAHNPKHQWYYLPRMARDEIIVFKVYDSARDGRARYTAHTAFKDPMMPENPNRRESIEIRTFAFFD
ncbi:MAG: hypothetical protein RLZ98_225 [Pseudomonadota bacterium]|jgi:hypothetical protein